MTEPSTTEGPQWGTLTAVSIGFLIGIVVVLGLVLDIGLLEIGVILLPILVVAGLAALALLWVKRRGDL